VRCISWDLLIQCESEIVGQLYLEELTMNNHWRDYQNSINSLKNELYSTNLIILAVFLKKSNLSCYNVDIGSVDLFQVHYRTVIFSPALMK
jgi:hypothetical protein